MKAPDSCFADTFIPTYMFGVPKRWNYVQFLERICTYWMRSQPGEPSSLPMSVFQCSKLLRTGTKPTQRRHVHVRHDVRDCFTCDIERWIQLSHKSLTH